MDKVSSSQHWQHIKMIWGALRNINLGWDCVSSILKLTLVVQLLSHCWGPGYNDAQASISFDSVCIMLVTGSDYTNFHRSHFIKQKNYQETLKAICSTVVFREKSLNFHRMLLESIWEVYSPFSHPIKTVFIILQLYTQRHDREL